MRASSTARANFSGIAGEAGGEQQHQPRHGDLAEQNDGDVQDHQAGQRLAGERPRRVRAVGVKTLGEERDEGGIERAFGKQPAEHAGDAERDEEGVGDVGGAEHGGNQHIARETQHAAQDGHRADGGKAAIELHQAESSAGSWRAWSAFSSRSRMADSRLLLVIFLPVRSVT